MGDRKEKTEYGIGDRGFNQRFSRFYGGRSCYVYYGKLLKALGIHNDPAVNLVLRV